MTELHIAKEILQSIVYNDVKFAAALRDKFVNDVSIREYRKVVSGLVGSELRHHLLFVYITKDIEGLSIDERLYCYLALAELYYYRRLDQVALKAELRNVLTEEHYAALEPLMEKAGKPEEYIPADVKSKLLRFSLQFNTPEWVLRVWQRYDERVMYRVLRANTRKAPITVRIANKNLTEDVLLLDHSFKKTNVAGIYTYEGTEALRKHPLYANKSIFVERPAIKATLDKFIVKDPCQVFLFNGAKNDAIMREFLATYGSSVAMHVGVYNVEDYPEFARQISRGYNNIRFFSADPLSMAASVSGAQDLVVCMPESTNFDLIREEPDYLLHFKKEEMDELFQKEKDALEGCSKYVADQGTLLYIVTTISRKEGHNTVAEFLKNHEEFSLVNELQLYPYDDLGTAMYYAVLHKGEKELKITPPLGDLTDAVSSSAGMCCSEK
ncbi:MAG: hypothetical protein MJ239_06725 [Bacilli bacterium]|nr:hypothetical protein [Bacilli bacterium]